LVIIDISNGKTEQIMKKSYLATKNVRDTINKMQKITSDISCLEADLEENKIVYHAGLEHVTAEQLIAYAQHNPHVLEMALSIAKEMENM
jgi:hypothetical protein